MANGYKATVIGAGLAGTEAAWQLARNGIPVRLIEMKPNKYSPAHKYSGFAELVCSNSLKSADPASACGMLKEEMRMLGSITMAAAEKTKALRELKAFVESVGWKVDYYQVRFLCRSGEYYGLTEFAVSDIVPADDI